MSDQPLGDVVGTEFGLPGDGKLKLTLAFPKIALWLDNILIKNFVLPPGYVFCPGGWRGCPEE